MGEGYKIGHYVEGIGVGVLTSVRLFVWAAFVFLRVPFSVFSDFARLHNQ